MNVETREKSEPFVPRGAPRRALTPYRWIGPAFAALVFGGLLFVPLHPAFPIVGALGLVATITLCVRAFRQWDRTGWYQYQPIVAPQLPYKVRNGPHNLTFQSTGVQISGWLCRDRFIPYSDVRRVVTHCQGVTLEGVEICLTDHPYYGADNAPELIREGSTTGKTTRVVLAILRQNAPHAAFSGPAWIEDGWIPRLGFGVKSWGEG